MNTAGMVIAGLYLHNAKERQWKQGVHIKNPPAYLLSLPSEAEEARPIFGCGKSAVSISICCCGELLMDRAAFTPGRSL